LFNDLIIKNSCIKFVINLFFKKNNLKICQIQFDLFKNQVVLQFVDQHIANKGSQIQPGQKSIHGNAIHGHAAAHAPGAPFSIFIAFSFSLLESKT
jgi:hypothetical protein